MVSEVSDPIRSVRLCPECPIVSDCVRKCPECPIVSDLKLGKLDISMHDPVRCLSGTVRYCPVLSGPVRYLSETCPVLLSDPVRKMSGMSGNVRECPEKCPECPIRAQALP